MEKNTKSPNIRKEAADIAKCAGLTCGRVVLLVCLFFLFLPMRPASVYLFFFIAIFPWIFSNILESKNPAAQQTALPYCAKKYLYTPARFLSEKYTGTGVIILLVVWQFSANSAQSLDAIWKLSPAVCLLVYCVCRLAGTLFFRRKIHREYFEMRLLEK